MVRVPLFLVEYDRRQQTRRVTVFADTEIQRANQELRAREAAKPPHMEVVLLSAESEDDLRKTHGRYFYTTEELLQRL